MQGCFLEGQFDSVVWNKIIIYLGNQQTLKTGDIYDKQRRNSLFGEHLFG